MDSNDDGFVIYERKKKGKPRGRGYEVKRYHKCGDAALAWIFDQSGNLGWTGNESLSQIKAATRAAWRNGATVPPKVLKNLRQAISGRKSVAASYLLEEKEANSTSGDATKRHEAFIGLLEDILIVLQYEG